MSTTTPDQINKIANEIAERAAYLNYLLAKSDVPVASSFTLAKIQRAQATLDLIELALTGAPDAVAVTPADTAPNDA